jgi:NAD(P)-dependent dehydrogenase (short-subunit alcohol dehydrogenase family)
VTTLLLGSAGVVVDDLAAALGPEVEVLAVPTAPSPADEAWTWAPDLERWRDEHATGLAVERVVVAPWPDGSAPAASLHDLTPETWVSAVEVELARWFAALGVAVRRCRDGGAVVAVVERPPPLDAADRSVASAVADAAEALVRSLARSDGRRGVRVNAVTTPTRLVTPPVIDPPPPLPSFPGSVSVEVAGAVRLLLSTDAAGVTGTVVHADCGRSWR